MIRYSMLISVVVFTLLLAPWTFIQAEENPIDAANLTQYSEGTVAPGFAIKNLDGKPVRLKDFRGKVVMVFFWATW